MDVAEKVCVTKKDRDGRFVVTWNIAGAIKTTEECVGMLKLYRLVFEVVNPFRAGFGTASGMVHWIESVVWLTANKDNYEMIIGSIAHSFKGHPIDRVVFLNEEDAEKFSYELEKRYITWILKQ